MTSFEDRWKHLFDQLKEAEKQANFVTQTPSSPIDVDNRLVVRNKVRQTRAEMRQFRGKDSIFKRPEAPLAQCVAPRAVPGFKKNPDKWVCYDLHNVPDVSERSNSEAAAICLKELEKQSDESNEDMTEDNTSANTKITFKQPIYVSKPKTSSSSDPKNIVYKNSIVIYPEHVVGQREKEVRVRKDKPKTEDAKMPQLRLDHLIDDEDCD